MDKVGKLTMDSIMDNPLNLSSANCKNWTSDYDSTSQSLLYWNSAVFSNFTPELFAAESQGHSGCNSGRGKVKRFVQEGEALVLRHFHRGGWVRKISRDLYLLPPGRLTRVESEVRLLLEMLEKNLPVPEPVAWRVQRRGVFCKMDLVLKEITRAQNLVEILRTRALSEEHWQRVGKTIRTFHEAEVCHSDLNAHNILLDDNNKVWLVDFDKSCLIKSFSVLWRKQNLARLQRSLKKERARNAEFHWAEDAWQQLLQGY